MGAAASVCVLRAGFAVLTGRRTDWAADAVDVAMAAAMIVMVVGGPSGSSVDWALAFVAAAVVFAVRATHTYLIGGARVAAVRGHGSHAALAAAMVPMLLAPTGAAVPMRGMAAAGPGLAGWRVVAVLAVLAVAVVAARDWCARAATSCAALAPRTDAACRLVMALAMAYLLVSM